MTIVSIDIGSTWTKGAAFSLSEEGGLRVLGRASHPTTVDDLSRGFEAVLGRLSAVEPPQRVFYSSSAKGGLAIAAIGIVPELTAEMARLTAYSAGAKLTHSFAYALNSADIATLRTSGSDIVLLAGGADGGNGRYPVENARKLADAGLSTTIVYAGNRDVRDRIEQILAGCDLVCVDNILPKLDCPNPEPARAAIQAVFLDRITKGKGLDKIVAAVGSEPSPTPYALFEYCRSVAEHAPELGEFLVVDMGGATTDVYSVHDEKNQVGTVRRGLPEAKVKRTVEGDLGMRVSARSAASAVRALYPDDALEGFSDYVERLVRTPEILPADEDERRFDAMLAGANLAHSVMRHSGRSHQVSTPDGLVTVQVGRDLTGVSRIIGTGGYLAASEGFRPHDSIGRIGADEHGRRVLAPAKARYLRDPDYLLPLLANVARAHPAAAVRAGMQALVEQA